MQKIVYGAETTTLARHSLANFVTSCLIDLVDDKLSTPVILAAQCRRHCCYQKYSRLENSAEIIVFFLHF